MIYLLKIAFRNVIANFRHSLAALLSISAAFMAIVIFDGYVTHIRNLYLNSYRYRGMFGDVILENQQIRSKLGKTDPWLYSLNSEQQLVFDQFIIKHQDQVVASVKNLNLFGSVTNGKVSAVFFTRAYDVDEGLKMRSYQSEEWKWNVLYGKPFHESDEPAKILVGQTIGQTLGCEPVARERVITKNGGYRSGLRPFVCKTDDIQLSLTTESGQLNAMDFKPIGLVDAGYRDIDARYLMLPLDQAQKLAHTDKVSYYTVMLKNSSDSKSNTKANTETFIAAYNQEIGEKFPDLKMSRWQDHEIGDLFKKTMELLMIFKNFVIIVIVFISCLSIFSTFVKNVKERTREIGLLLSLGFYRSQVLKIFLLESALLSLFGISGGAIVGFIASAILNSSSIYYKAGLLSEPVVFQVAIDPSSILVSALGLIFVAVISCYLSVSTTIRQKIVDCLQHS